jgi:DNA polymerase-3 subunit alpha/error-prone DNA polymerase
VRRLKGGKWEPLHPLLEHILNETYGILCYQEDVSKTAVALANFNEADADKLRKVIAKKAGSAKLAVYENQFFEGCRNNSVPEETIKKIWEMMLSFDGYSFCKPHSASYAMVSFQSAYLRVHYPAEFMAAVISNQGGYYRPGAYISECRRMGLILEGPDINSSRWKYYGLMNNEQRGIFRGTVVIGLMAIKGLSASGAQAIVTEREKGGNFVSLEDFVRRVKLGRDDIIALCPAGVFDSIAADCPRTMQARKLLMTTNGNRNNELGMNGELFAKETKSSYLIANEKDKIIPNSKHLIHNLIEEYKALGFLRHTHPLALWKEQIKPLKRIKARHIEEYTGRIVQMIGWQVTQKEVWTKDGLTMSFLSLEDETGLYETVVFPHIYDKYNKLLFDQIPLLVSGKVCNDHGATVVEVQRISDLTTDLYG